MNIRFLHGTALIAGLGAAIALAGCGGNNTAGGGGTTGLSSANSNDAIATVGGTNITHGQLGSFLEAQSGKQALPYLIDLQLIFEEGKAKNINVTDAEIEADLQRRAKSDPSLETVLKTPGPQVDFIKMQVKRELIVQQLLTQDVKLDEAKVKEFFNKYQTYYNEPARYKVGLLASSTKAKAEAMERALKSKSKTFEALVAEQKANQKDVAGVALSNADRNEFQVLDGFPPAIRTQLSKLPKGGVTGVTEQQVGLPTPVYVIFKAIDVQPAKKADFTALKAQVETDYKLAQVAKTEVEKGKTNPTFDTAIVRTLAALTQSQAQQNPTAPPPTLRDVFSYMLQPASQNLIDSLRTKGTVQITDPVYTSVAERYQPQTTPSPSGTPAADGSAPTASASPSATPAG